MTKFEKDMGIIKPKERPIPRERYRSKRKKKKKSDKTWEEEFYGCVFCGHVIPRKGFYSFDRAKECVNPLCNAEIVDFCPACKKRTWYQPGTGLFRHWRFGGCGFRGTKRKDSHDLTQTN